MLAVNAKESEMLKEKVLQLKMQRELLKKKLEDRLHALRELCLAEAVSTWSPVCLLALLK